MLDEDYLVVFRNEQHIKWDLRIFHPHINLSLFTKVEQHAILFR